VTTDIGRTRYLEFQRLARHLGRPTDELLTLYAMEAFLARAAASRFADRIVLKGGMLMSHLAERRPTRDIDLHTIGFSNSVTDVQPFVVDVATSELLDGVSFDIDTARAEQIREAAGYSGVRSTMDAHIHTARVRLRIDFSFGDPVEPAPTRIELERVHPEMEPLVILGYPLTMVLAEKIVTAVSRGIANTRWRDFADIIAITRASAIAGADAYGSIRVVADHRRVELSPISALVDAYESVAASRWATWHANQGYEVIAPANLRTALQEVSRFADTAISTTALGQTWRPDVGWSTDR